MYTEFPPDDPEFIPGKDDPNPLGDKPWVSQFNNVHWRACCVSKCACWISKFQNCNSAVLCLGKIEPQGRFIENALWRGRMYEKEPGVVPLH